MDQLLKTQLSRTKILMDALEVAKICDNPAAEQLILDIRRCTNKSQTILDKFKEVQARKKEISEDMDVLANKCDFLAHRTEKINKTVFPNQTFNSSTPLKNENQDRTQEQSTNGLDISPCPTTWDNGILESPMPQSGPSNNRNPSSVDIHIPCIRPLHPNEMQAVPAYMKGRLTHNDINTFISTVNSVLKQKYSIVLLKRKDVKRKFLVLYSEWKSQEQEFGMIGKAFFTANDLLNLGHQKLDKIADKIIQILRHSNRLRQTRVNGKVVVYSLM